MISRDEIDAFYDELDGIRRGDGDLLPAMEALYTRVKAAYATLHLEEVYHKIHEATSSGRYYIRFFASEDVSVSVMIFLREFSYSDDEHLGAFDREFLELAARMMDVRLRVDYAIDDYKEARLRNET